MRCRFIFLIGLLLIINSAFAQWHYTITSQSFYGGCSSISATINVTVLEQGAQIQAAQTYDSQAECEQVRREWGMINYSSGGCYARVTSSPCQGNTGGLGSNGIYYGEPSLYNSLGSDGYMFSPTERDINQNTYEEYQMRQDAFGYNSGNAQKYNPNKMSARTGDESFDNVYMKQINQIKKNDNQGIYNFISRDEFDWTNATPRIGQIVTLENYEIINNIGPKVNPDQQRLYNQNIDELNEKLDKISDSICLKNAQDIRHDKRFVGVANSVYDFAAISYKTGTSMVNGLDDAIKLLEDGFGMEWHGAEAFHRFSSYLNDADNALKVSGKLIIEDWLGAAETMREKLTEKLTEAILDPSSDIIDGMVVPSSGYKRFMQMASDGNLVGNITKKGIKTVLSDEAIQVIVYHKHSSQYEKNLYGFSYNTERSIMKQITQRNKSGKSIKIKQNEKQ